MYQYKPNWVSNARFAKEVKKLPVLTDVVNAPMNQKTFLAISIFTAKVIKLSHS